MTSHPIQIARRSPSHGRFVFWIYFISLFVGLGVARHTPVLPAFALSFAFVAWFVPALALLFFVLSRDFKGLQQDGFTKRSRIIRFVVLSILLGAIVSQYGRLIPNVTLSFGQWLTGVVCIVIVVSAAARLGWISDSDAAKK